MHFEDLTTYSYASDRPLPGVVNVGWLEAGHAFATGVVSDELQQKLADAAVEQSVNVMRGFHYCGFCDQEEIWVRANGRSELLGCAELWIPSPAVIFAAPNLIHHYVTQHGYRPPSSFLEALQRYNPREEWDPAREFEVRVTLAMDTDPSSDQRPG